MSNETSAVNEWTKRDTADGESTFEEAEWVEPGEGVVIEGVLMRAFVLRDELGGDRPFRACYVIADDKGDEWTFGEKASFKSAIRSLKMGVTMRLTFLKKEKMTDPKTKKPTGKTIWRTRLDTKDEGVGEAVIDALKKSHAELMAKGEDVPF